MLVGESTPHWRTRLLDLMFPPRCTGCDEALLSGLLCEDCARALWPLQGRRCPRCDHPLPQDLVHQDGPSHDQCDACEARAPRYERALACWRYEGSASVMIRRAKYGGDELRWLGLLQLARPWLMSAREALLPALDAGAILSAVPMTRRALLKRGFNPAAMFAREASRQWRTSAGRRPTLALELLRRTRHRKQASLSDDARRANMEGAYRGEGSAPPCVILFDDVLTTGATADACADALRAIGAQRVLVVALARAVREG